MNIDDFCDSLDDFADEIEEDLVEMQRDILRRAYSILLSRAPMPPGEGGYSTGRYRENQQVLIDGFDSSPYDLHGVRLGSTIVVQPGPLITYGLSVEYGADMGLWPETPGYRVYEYTWLLVSKIVERMV